MNKNVRNYILGSLFTDFTITDRFFTMNEKLTIQNFLYSVYEYLVLEVQDHSASRVVYEKMLEIERIRIL